MLLFNTILPIVLFAGLASWHKFGDRFSLYLGLLAIPLWYWAYTLLGGL